MDVEGKKNYVRNEMIKKGVNDIVTFNKEEWNKKTRCANYTEYLWQEDNNDDR